MGLDYSFVLVFPRQQARAVMQKLGRWGERSEARSIDFIIDDAPLRLPFEVTFRNEERVVDFDALGEAELDTSLGFPWDRVLRRGWAQQPVQGSDDLRAMIGCIYAHLYQQGPWFGAILSAATTSMSREFQTSSSMRTQFCALLDAHEGVVGILDREDFPSIVFWNGHPVDERWFAHPPQDLHELAKLVGASASWREGTDVAARSSTEADLLANLVAAPMDPARWEVYADWLTEFGRPGAERQACADYVRHRADVALHRALCTGSPPPGQPPSWRKLLGAGWYERRHQRRHPEELPPPFPVVLMGVTDATPAKVREGYLLLLEIPLPPLRYALAARALGLPTSGTLRVFVQWPEFGQLVGEGPPELARIVVAPEETATDPDLVEALDIVSAASADDWLDYAVRRQRPLSSRLGGAPGPTSVPLLTLQGGECPHFAWKGTRTLWCAPGGFSAPGGLRLTRVEGRAHDG